MRRANTVVLFHLEVSQLLFTCLDHMGQRPFLSISPLCQPFDLPSLLGPVNVIVLLKLCSNVLKDGRFLFNEVNRPVAEVL